MAHRTVCCSCVRGLQRDSASFSRGDLLFHCFSLSCFTLFTSPSSMSSPVNFRAKPGHLRVTLGSINPGPLGWSFLTLPRPPTAPQAVRPRKRRMAPRSGEARLRHIHQGRGADFPGPRHCRIRAALYDAGDRDSGGGRARALRSALSALGALRQPDRAAL